MESNNDKKQCDAFPILCEKRFNELEHEVQNVKKDTAQSAVQIDQIHTIVCGDGNGIPSMGEQFRSLIYEKERNKKRIQVIEDHIQNAGWRLWQKITAVIVTFCAVGGFIFQMIRTL